MDQSLINMWVIIALGVILLILLMMLLSKTDFIKRLLSPTITKDLKNSLESKERHLKLCEADIKKCNEELELYKSTEKILNCGGWEWSLDKEVDELKYTDNLADVLEVVKGQLMTKTQFLNNIHKDDVERVKKSLVNAENGVHYEIEYRVGKRNGSMQQIKCCGVPELNIDNVLVKIKGAILVLTTHETT